jgi:hypothetical protein
VLLLLLLRWLVLLLLRWLVLVVVLVVLRLVLLLRVLQAHGRLRLKSNKSAVSCGHPAQRVMRTIHRCTIRPVSTQRRATPRACTTSPAPYVHDVYTNTCA